MQQTGQSNVMKLNLRKELSYDEIQPALCFGSNIFPIISPVKAGEEDFPVFKGPYLGQRPPGLRPEVFAIALTSNDYENGGFVFSNNGNEVAFFSIDRKGKYFLRYSRIEDGRWLKPKNVFQSNSGNDVHPFFSGDDRRLYFGSNRRMDQNKVVPYSNIWVSKKIDGQWQEPKSLPTSINTGFENCGSFCNGDLLFFRRVSPDTRGDIFLSNYVGSEFGSPVKLPASINTVFDESHPAISPDCSYLIFSSKRPSGLSKGKDELWISFRNKNGEWSDAEILGNEINNGCNTSCATISPDGKYIFFSRITNGVGVPYWVSAEIVEELRPKR